MPLFARQRRSRRGTAKNAVAFARAIVNHAAPSATARSPKPREEEGSVKSQMTMAARRLGSQFALGSMIALAACATPPSDPAARADFVATNDPLEPMNRDIFDFNLFLDRILIKPVAQGYRTVVPEFGRDAIRHFLNNLGEPVIFANDMMQGEFKAAHDTVARFLINSTFGVGGLRDLASETGLERQTGDFGQTLYRWGAPEGPYLVLPIFGPSNPRDAIGMGIDGVMDPFGYLAGDYGAANSATISRMAASGVDLRSRNIETLDDLERNAIDFYAQIRSLSRQHRADELRHGRPGPMPNLDTSEGGPSNAAAAPAK
jgi:phospholipid-binding lipoprotein MlaA